MSATGFRQNSPGYFIALDTVEPFTIVDGAVDTTSWTAATGEILKDMGTTVVSSMVTFRKVQKVLPDSAALSTFGVGGNATGAEAYLTGYIVLGYEGYGTPAKVACFGK